MVQELTPFEKIGARRRSGGIPQKYILDEPGRRLLLAKYDGRSETIDELAQLLCVPRWKVMRWGRDLGLARQSEPRWSAEDIAYLERHLHKKSLASIAKTLGRTQTAVRLKVKKLGVNKCLQEGYTMSALCLAFGCDHHKIKKWIEAGWLKGHRRQTQRLQVQGGDVWLFYDQDIRKLIVDHPQEIDPRRADWLWLVDVLVGGANGLGAL